MFVRCARAWRRSGGGACRLFAMHPQAPGSGLKFWLAGLPAREVVRYAICRDWRHSHWPQALGCRPQALRCRLAHPNLSLMGSRLQFGLQRTPAAVNVKPGPESERRLTEQPLEPHSRPERRQSLARQPSSSATSGSQCQSRCRRQRWRRCRASPMSSRSPAPTFAPFAAWTVSRP
jgi:hypothetical protein